jgi:hypothetical protein
VTEVPEQPPEALGSAHVSVGDDEDAVADPRLPGGSRETLRARQGMPPLALDRKVGEIFVDVQERRPGDVAGEVELPTSARVAELPATVDELVAVYGAGIPARSGARAVDGPLVKRSPLMTAVQTRPMIGEMNRE